MDAVTSLLVLGGARSGKSRYAQVRAEALGLRQVYVATGQAFDDEMRERIARHRADRGADWETLEAPLDLAGAIASRAEPATVLLIDCLTLWITNLILVDRDVGAEAKVLCQAIRGAGGQIIVVSNEVGFGIVPENALARRFRDEAGIVNQMVAEAVDEIVMTVAGIPLRLKPDRSDA